MPAQFCQNDLGWLQVITRFVIAASGTVCQEAERHHLCISMQLKAEAAHDHALLMADRATTPALPESPRTRMPPGRMPPTCQSTEKFCILSALHCIFERLTAYYSLQLWTVQ